MLIDIHHQYKLCLMMAILRRKSLFKGALSRIFNISLNSQNQHTLLPKYIFVSEENLPNNGLFLLTIAILVRRNS